MKQLEVELPFIDREEELAQLKGLFDHAAEGIGKVVLVRGEGGVGKTRLVHELGHYAKNGNSIFAVGPSYQGEDLIPYLPWINVIRSIIHQTNPSAFTKLPARTVSEVGRLVPELAVGRKELGIGGWIAGSSEGQTATSATEVDRFRLFQSVTDFLIHASKEKPIVLFFDDVQWADAASVQLIRFFCRRLSGEKIMLVATYRDTELPEDHPLTSLLLDLTRERMLEKIELSRLNLRHLSGFISSHLGGGLVAPDFVQLIYSRTGGNPFFVEELLSTLREAAKVWMSEAGWNLRDLGHVELPSTIRAVIKQRVARLGEDTSQLLSVGALIGMDFEYRLLRMTTSYEEDTLIKHLEKAVRAGLVKERSSGSEVSYLFADELVRDFLIEELSLIRRRKIHTRFAEAMEDLYKEEKSLHSEELAHHYIEGANAAKGVEYSLLAGDRAAALHAHSAAIKHYTNVLDLLEETQQKERIEVLIKLGDVAFYAFEREVCTKYYLEAVALASKEGQKKMLARIYSKLGLARWAIGFDKSGALESLKQGLDALESEENSLEEASISEFMGRLLVNSGELGDGLHWCKNAIRISKKLNAYETLAFALISFALGLQRVRENKEAIFQHLEESVSISIDHGLEEPLARAYQNLGYAYESIKADYMKAKECLVKSIDHAGRMVSMMSHWRMMAEGSLAFRSYIPLGEWEEALKVANRALRFSSDLGEFATPLVLPTCGIVYLLKGDLDQAEEYLIRAYPLVERSQLIEVMYPCLWALGRLYRKRCDLEKAEGFLKRGVEIGLTGGWTDPPLEVYFELLGVYCMKGDVEKAEDYYEKIRVAAEQIDENWTRAYERWANGLLSLLRKDWKEAKVAFKASSDFWGTLEHPYHHAQTTLELGRVLANAGELEEATKRIEEAKTIFTRLGAKLDLAELDNQSATIPPSSEHLSSGPISR